MSSGKVEVGLLAHEVLPIVGEGLAIAFLEAAVCSQRARVVMLDSELELPNRNAMMLGPALIIVILEIGRVEVLVKQPNLSDDFLPYAEQLPVWRRFSQDELMRLGILKVAKVSRQQHDVVASNNPFLMMREDFDAKVPACRDSEVGWQGNVVDMGDIVREAQLVHIVAIVNKNEVANRVVDAVEHALQQVVTVEDRHNKVWQHAW